MFSALTGASESGASFRGAQLTQEMSLGLFQKKKFRAYREFTTTTTLKLVFGKPFVLTLQKLWTGQGSARVVITTGSTEGGTFVAMPTKFCLNTTAGDVAGSTTITVGGTATGGTEREVLRSDSSTAGGGSGNQDSLGSPRILGAGTFYITITVTGTTAGMYSLEWEELDALPVVT